LFVRAVLVFHRARRSATDAQHALFGQRLGQRSAVFFFFFFLRQAKGLQAGSLGVTGGIGGSRFLLDQRGAVFPGLEDAAGGAARILAAKRIRNIANDSNS
jgi:hypothetical protein